MQNNFYVYFINDFYDLIVFFFLLLILVSVLFGLSFFLGRRILDPEKLSAYECGFNPFEDARQPFDVRFYLVTILFIIFDLEITFLFPWSVVLGRIGFFGFFSMFIFISVLTVGLFYEWYNGALDWE